MSSSVLRHALPVGAIVVAAAVPFACNDHHEVEPTDPHDRVDAIEDAFASPTAEVDSTAMKIMAPTFDAISLAATVMLAVSEAPKAKVACLDGNAKGGKVDLPCATDRQVTGSVAFSVETSGDSSSGESFETITFHDACFPGFVCVGGTIATRVELESGKLSTTIAVAADVARSGGATSHVFYGSRATKLEDDPMLSKLAVFDGSGNSYVWIASETSEGLTWSVDGKNGRFSCVTRLAPNDSFDIIGTCTGASRFDF